MNGKSSRDLACATAECRAAATVAVEADESGVRKRSRPSTICAVDVGQVSSRGSTLARVDDGVAIEQDPAAFANKPVGDDADGVDQCTWHQATMTSMPRSGNAASCVALMARSVMNVSEAECLGNKVTMRGQ